MATLTSFEEIKAWQKARQLAQIIWALSNQGTFAVDHPLRDQINRSTGSVMDNIAEGFEREGNNEFVNMLSYSKGSAGEARSQLIRALDRNHISGEQFEYLNNEALEICRMINGLMRYLNNSRIRGTKFKGRK